MPLAVALFVALSAFQLLTGCESSGVVRADWHVLPPDQLPSPPGSLAFPDAVLGAGASQPWLIGGVIVTPQPATTEGLVVTNEQRQVAIWEAATPRGRWDVARMKAVPDRDGPFETVLYFARRSATSVAFGSRASPTEGYPRPSAWTRTGAGWQEALEPRELFGGPNIIGFGGMAAGPHGLFIGGTWSDSHGHAEASVWSSADGSAWARVSDPSFEGTQGETPIGGGVADNKNGLLLIATIEAPTPQSPGAEHGGAWYSQDGRSWTRVNPTTRAQSTFGAVVPSGQGWLVAGTVGAGSNRRAAVWTVRGRPNLGKPSLLPGAATADSKITAAWSSAMRLYVAGVAGGRPALWSAALDHHGVPRGWTRLRSPGGAFPDLQRVAGSSSSNSTVVVLIGKNSSEVLWS
jgi:hypothetical protein